MKKAQTIFISRSKDYTSAGFGFTVRHFVIYPPSVTVNDILRASYSVVIDEHQQKLLETGTNTNGSTEEGTTTTTNPSGILSSSSSSVGLIHHQGEQQRSSSSLSTSSTKICPNDLIQEDGTTSINTNNSNLQSIDTIFVKEVRPDGPAYQSGLRQGDRILTINGQSIHGKTYSQVIAMIQNAPADLVLKVLPKNDEINPLNLPEQIRSNVNQIQPSISNQNLNQSHLTSVPYLKPSLTYRPSTLTSTTMLNNNNTIEQKLRNLQINLAQGRTAEELAQAGIYFPPPTTSSSSSSSSACSSSSTGASLLTLPLASTNSTTATTTTSTTTTASTPLIQQNIFSNYIDSVHRALDHSKQQQQQQTLNKSDSLSTYQSPYHDDYIHYDYQRISPTRTSFSYTNNYNENSEQRNFLNTNVQLNQRNISRPSVVSPRSNISYLVNPTSSYLNPLSNPLLLKGLNRIEEEDPSIKSKSSTNNNDSWKTTRSYSSERKDKQELKSSSTDDSTKLDKTTTSLISPSSDKSLFNENEIKTEFVNFRKKQFETGHVENLLRDPQRESKTKKYSEKKKYESEWTRLTAIADVQSVMDRASHFEDIDRDKFARLKSKLPTSSPINEDLIDQDQFFYDFHLTNFNQIHLNPNNNQMKYFKSSLRSTNPADSSFLSFRHSQVTNENNLSFDNYDPRFIIEQVENKTNPLSSSSSTSQFNNSTLNQSCQYPLENYPLKTSSSHSGNNLLMQGSYLANVRSSTNNNDQPQFVTEFDNPLRLEKNIKENRSPFILSNNQRTNYLQNDFSNTNSTRPTDQNYSYQLINDQSSKTRTRSPHQTQAIKKLKHFFGENTRSLIEQLEDRPSLCQSPLSPQSSSGGQSKSGSFFDGSTVDGNSNTRESISITTMPEQLEPSKEGILYCKMVLKEGRRAPDRSWRGAWAVLRRGALFLGKEKKHGYLIPLSCDSFPINLQNAEVELASDYMKKPRVFKLITANQSEYLFQAADIQSLNEWLELLQEHTMISSSKHHHRQTTIETRDQSKDGLNQRPSSSSLPPSIRSFPHSNNDQQNSNKEINEKRQSTSNNGSSKSKLSLRSPSLKRSPSLRFRKSHKSSINTTNQSQSMTNSNLNESTNANANGSNSPRRSFVKSIVKKGLRTLKSSSSLLTSQMSGQIYDESSGESINTGSINSQNSLGMNFSIELEECESSSISQYIPIVVEILTRLVELRAIDCQGIYRHAGGLTAVNWLVNELDKGSEKIDFNSEKWYDVKAVASTLKTFFAKLPDSLLSSKLSSLSVEASRIENHRDRLIELKKILFQLDNYRFETLKYLCAHFRRVTSKCHLNKIDARNLAIIFGPTLIWDSKASLQSNLVDNPEKIRIIESFILYYQWFFDENEFHSIPAEINPQMPKLPSIDHSTNEIHLNNETKPGEIIQTIIFAAKRRWSSTMFIESLSSITTNNDQQTAKPINISVKSVVRQN